MVNVYAAHAKFNKVSSSIFLGGYRDWQALDEGQRLEWTKRCVNNKNEDNDPIINNINKDTSPQKSRLKFSL